MALHLRAATELIIWAAFFHFGVTIAFNIITHEWCRREQTALYCEHFEQFVRGAISVAPSRWEASNRVTGEPNRVTTSSEHVAESTASISKQGEIARHMAVELDKREKTTLVNAYDALDAGYHALSGLVHVSPALLLTEIDDVSRGPFEDMTLLAARVLDHATELAEGLAFHARFRVVRFLPLAVRCTTPDVQKIVRLELPELVQLRTADDKVKVNLAGGRELTLYRGRHRRS